MAKLNKSISLGAASMEEAFAVKPELKKYAERLRALDKDGNGQLDLAEVCENIDAMVSLEKDRRMLKWVAIVMGVFALLTTAATAGLTYAVVALSKDTTVNSGVLTTTAGDTLVFGTHSMRMGYDPAAAEMVETAVNGTGRRLLAAKPRVDALGRCTEYAGRTELYAVQDLCAKLAPPNNVDTFIMELQDSSCRTDETVLFSRDGGDDGSCPFIKRKVAVNWELCETLTKTASVCLPPLDDTKKAAKTNFIVTATESSPDFGTLWSVSMMTCCLPRSQPARVMPDPSAPRCAPAHSPLRRRPPPHCCRLS